MSSELLDHCAKCHRVCLETVAHCLGVGGSHVLGDHVQGLLDSAELCGTLVSFLARGSDAIDALLSTCGDLCERSARDCEGFADAQMKACALACRACADACRQHLSFLAA